MGRRSSAKRAPAFAKASAGRRHRDAAPSTQRSSRAWLIAGVAITLIAIAAWWFGIRSSVARDGSPSWSPDGSRIAFYSERDGNAEIYVMNADGSGQTRLTTTAADEGYPAWSPDGRTIAFDSDRDGNFEIYAMNPDGTSVRRLTNHPARDVSASWSPDATKIAFMSDRDGGFEVYVMNADGSGADRRSSTGTSWFPMWSPDGSRLAFHVGRDVHVAASDGSNLRRLTVDPANGMYPSWSPDGERIAFMSWRNGRTELFVMKADGSDQTKLLAMDSGDAIDPRWSPDGSRIVFVHLPGGMNSDERIIAVVNADGTGLRRLSR
jgi:Tol biopolymer transport system component